MVDKSRCNIHQWESRPPMKPSKALAVANRVCCPNAGVLVNIWGRRTLSNPEHPGTIHHGTEAQVQRTNHVHVAEGRQDTAAQCANSCGET